MILRTDPARVRLILAHYDRHGWAQTLNHFGVHSTTLRRWYRARAAFGPEWPTLDMDAHWLARRDTRKVKAAKLAAWRKRRYLNGGQPLLVDATGTTRRIQALARLGWPTRILAEHGPWTTGEALQEIAKRGRITRANADAVARIYDQMSMTPGPSPWTRAYAERAGWLPPLAWDDIDHDPEPPTHEDDNSIDHAAVHRILGGEWGLRCTPAERGEVVRRWVASGRSQGELERVSGWNACRYYKQGDAA